MTFAGFVLLAAASPDGMANTSHQTSPVGGQGGGRQGRQVPGSFGSSTHWRGSVFGAGATTYWGIGTVFPLTRTPITCPVLGSVMFSFGSNTSVIWNGLMWMWNGW